jgi:hypothetical protein
VYWYVQLEPDIALTPKLLPELRSDLRADSGDRFPQCAAAGAAEEGNAEGKIRIINVSSI